MADPEATVPPVTEAQRPRRRVRRWFGIPAALYRGAKRSVKGLIVLALLMLLGNAVFSSQRGIPYRALDPESAPCKTETGWDILSKSNDKQVANDEWSAIDNDGAEWRTKFACAIQRHVVPGYIAADGTERSLAYDLAFLEFQEDGKPYALRQLCSKQDKNCTDEGFGEVKLRPASQLGTILQHINPDVPNYVMVFIHGWRHDASIGDANVSEFREYAAHVARFVEDRWTDKTSPKPKVTAIYIGWRGARTDETKLQRSFGRLGQWIGASSAILTLFDRKPVSEAIAPSVLSGLRAIEQKLKIAQPLPPALTASAAGTNKMIVFGHSLGGNLLATALQDDVEKKIGKHRPGTYMRPVLGDLVVLINPASEAAKWISFQRAVWSQIAFHEGERRPFEEYSASHTFFRRDQRPIVLSVTAARDWPPGGRRQLDCFTFDRSDPVAKRKETESRVIATEGFNYDWATYDMFPAFKGDLRPAADTLRRIALDVDPHDACDATPISLKRQVFAAPLVAISSVIRVLPFMQTDPEQTHTIGNLDPPRSPRGALKDYYFTARPFGTTHELRGLEPGSSGSPRFLAAPDRSGSRREIPATYTQVIAPEAACPVATSWLTVARNETERLDRERHKTENHGTGWTSAYAGAKGPALEFRHGFLMAGIAPITRANDPFWNMRAFDDALARHDGYMLSSFICAMNQLVMDDIVATPAPLTPTSLVPPAPAPPVTPPAL